MKARLLTLAAALAVLGGCAHRVCGTLQHADIEAFHESHMMSVSANASEVEDLATEGWQVCVERGVAKIQNHRTLGEDAEQWRTQ